MNSTLVIYNPIAGRGRVQALWPQVKQALQNAGIDFDAVQTQAPFEATKLAFDGAQKFQRIISVGGDGTFHEIVNGLMLASQEGQTIPLGLIPLGTGDDFAKMIPPETPIGGKALDWPAAVEKIARGQTHLYDVGRIKGGKLRPEISQDVLYFPNSMDVGFGAHSTVNMLTIPKFLKGLTAYTAAVLKTWVTSPVLHIRLQLDDQAPYEFDTNMTVVANIRSFGGGFWVCPHAQADDGLFDLMVADTLGRIKILGMIPKFMKGTHIHESVVHMKQARHVVFESKQNMIVEVDGELPFVEAYRLEMDILPKKLSIIV